MTQTAIQPLIDAVHAGGRPRVWSIVVTIFGDAVLPRGGSIPMAELTAIADRLGIADGALRTAMSRLAAEGWVTREKSGRTSTYSLSARATRDSWAAAGVIYAPTLKTKGDWLLALDPEPGEGPARLSPRLRLIREEDRDAEIAAGAMVFAAAPLNRPEWARDALAPPDWMAEVAALHALIEPLSRMNELRVADPWDALAARLAAIHLWRRLILRQPRLPVEVMGEDWPGYAAHDALARLYHLVLHKSEQAWAAPTDTAGRGLLNDRFAVAWPVSDPPEYVTKIR